MMNAAMTPQQKIEAIRQQIIQARAGLLSFITCPYCGKENTSAEVYLCCVLFAEASAAVLDRMDKQAAIDFLKTIEDKAILN